MDAWANATSVKIKWDDGEQVTWKRDSLAGRPIEFLDAAAEDDQPASPAAPAASEQPATTEVPQAEPEAAPATTEPIATEPVSQVSEPTANQAAPGASQEQAQMAAKPKRRRKAAAEPKVKKTSAIDAAVKVLAETGQPMNCQEMIDTMAAKGYWTSPGGKTPAATLYSAILREVANQGADARFVKTERGKFGLKS